MKKEEKGLLKYGTLENFPEEKKGLGTFWKEFEDKLKNSKKKLSECS